MNAAVKTPAPLALTMGEPGGVGAEISLKAWRALKETGPVFFLLDAPDRLQRLGAPIVEITDPREAAAHFDKTLPVISLSHHASAAPGVADAANAPAILESIERAVAFALEGHAGGVVTNPIQKSALLAGGFRFPGHTEYLAALTADAPMEADRRRGPVMMLAGPDLRTIPVTIHLSVKEAIAQLTPQRIVDAALIAEEALRRDFYIEKPRLAISGLNPHAGEGGALGAEEALIIAPAIDLLRAQGINVAGPAPADTMFHEEARSCYDVALCMLHDQALIPAKTLAFHEAVNVTLGLPIVRTSPDHGTALDIAGKNQARPDSLIAALKLAAAMAANRKRKDD